MQNYVNVGAGWMRKSKNGATYMRIKLDDPKNIGQYLLVWENKKKTQPGQPDYLVMSKGEDIQDVDETKDYVS